MKTKIFVIIACLCMPQVAYAGPPGYTLFMVCNLFVSIAFWLKSVGYVVAAITLARFSISASILGRFPAPNFVTWIIALFVLGSVPPIMSYLMSGNFTYQCPSTAFT